MRTDISKERAIAAAISAATSDINNLTADRIEALTAGHGMLNFSVFAVANVIIEELNAGGHLDVQNANAKRLPMETILRKCVEVCREGGCDPANAALISAVMMYMAGSAAQVGIPAGNRKLGALARMIAGNDRCGVSNIPTAKSNNKLSGFPAVAAIYKAMAEGKLTEINGKNVPAAASGTALCGHSALGEDYIFPQLAENGARIGTQAMMDAYLGVGLRPPGFTCAMFGAAAILEIVHPDAEVSEEIGPYGKFNSAMLAGRAAAEAARLPMTLHFRGTGEEIDTGRFIGDMGLILKDVGGPSVIGMMAVNEMVSAFKEGIAGASSSLINPPLGHICSQAVIGMKSYMYFGGDIKKAGEAVLADRLKDNINPEMAVCSLNVIAKKAAEIHRGPVTDLIVKATEPIFFNAMYERAAFAYEKISAGEDVADVAAALDKQRVEACEKNVSEFYTGKFKEPVEAKITEMRPGARRKQSKLAQKYLAFDGYFEVEIKKGEQVKVLKNTVDKILPEVSLGLNTDPDMKWALAIACPLCMEQIFSANNLFNVVLPAAMSALLGQHEPEEAAKLASGNAMVSASIPGCQGAAKNVAELAASLV